MQLWKIPINSQRDDFQDHPEKTHLARNFCFQKGWVGIGWGIDAIPDKTTTPKLYEEKIHKEYPKVKKSAFYAHQALAYKMEPNDLVWCRESNNIYWIGKVTGSWIYRSVDEFREFDLYQVRSCVWQRVGSSDQIPGKVKNAFAGRGGAIRPILSEYALRRSIAIWLQLTGEKIAPDKQDDVALTLAEVGHDDLEDLVILYIQAKFDWFVVASTAKHSTPETECVLRNREGKRAHVQVKSGKSAIEIDKLPVGIDKFYVFDLVSECASSPSDGIMRISPKDLEQYLLDNLFLLPNYLQNLGRLYTL